MYVKKLSNHTLNFPIKLKGTTKRHRVQHIQKTKTNCFHDRNTFGRQIKILQNYTEPNSLTLMVFNPIQGRGALRASCGSFLYLVQKPLYLINHRLSTFLIYLLGLRICKKNRLRYGVCAHWGHDHIQKMKKCSKFAYFELHLPL